MDNIQFFDCYVIYWTGKHHLAVHSLSHKPDTEYDQEPPETRASLPSIIDYPLIFFTQLTRQKQQILLGLDPKLIGTGKYWANNVFFWRYDNKKSQGLVKEVLCL